LRQIRIDLVRATRRVNDQADSFSYNIVRSLVAGERPADIPLSERDDEFLTKIDAQFEEA